VKRDDLRRQRNLHKEPQTLDQPASPEWLKKYGYELKYTRTYLEDLSDAEVRDRYWGHTNKCLVTRNGRDLTYVSFRHHKVVRMLNPDAHLR